jgi:hypothetical protein
VRNQVEIFDWRLHVGQKIFFMPFFLPSWVISGREFFGEIIYLSALVDLLKPTALVDLRPAQAPNTGGMWHLILFYKYKCVCSCGNNGHGI